MEKQDDPLQQQISLQNMFDAIKVIKKQRAFFIITELFLIKQTAEVYESIEKMTGDDTKEKLVLKDFCNVSRKLHQ